ncbi:MAG: ABC transporter permease [Ruminococcaceae bacterium]|nr:ABC transporter permease [Oscillospiraceae bacterium]
MRAFVFAKRNFREILRDPLTLFFGLGFPLVLLFLLSAIQRSIPVSLFEIEHLTPGISVFGLSFVTLFSGFLISKDRSSAFMSRLYTTPMTALDFIIGYTLPLIPLGVLQSIVCYLAATIFGLKLSLGVVFALLLVVPTCAVYIGMGLLFGSILNDKQVGGICGALVTNVSAWLSGTWFDLELVGGTFKKIAYALPFVHGVELQRCALSGNFGEMLPHLLWVIGWAVVILVAAVLLFLRQMKKQ